MSLQARFDKNDPRLVSANRDVAHNFRFVVETVAERLEDERWTPLTVYLENAGVTQEQLGAGMKAFITFVATAVQNPDEHMGDALNRSGWFDLPEAVHVAVMSTLGTVMTGVYFQGAREATLGGEGPCSDVAALVAAGERCSKLLQCPRWLRPLYRLRLRIGRAFNALRG